MTSVADYKLFTPLALGEDLVLKNRVVMAPMGRAHADKATYEPLEIAQTYYAQRAGAGLIVSEATPISEQGYGWYGSPALYTPAHAAAWKTVTDAVHARGGKIFLQMWHMGRQSHSSFNAKREVVAPCAIVVPTGQPRNSQGDHATYETPRALETREIPGIADDFRKGAALAKLAGFDGVEIHAANGFLIDTFLQSSTNTRTDQYGGSIENRMRFLLEVLDAVQAEWPPHRIGVRLSPNGVFGSMGSADNVEQFTATAARLDGRGLAYLALLDGPGFGFHDKGRLVTTFDVKRVFSGNVFATTGYTRDIAEGAMRSGAADAVCFGRPFIANPDLVERFKPTGRSRQSRRTSTGGTQARAAKGTPRTRRTSQRQRRRRRQRRMRRRRVPRNQRPRRGRILR